MVRGMVVRCCAHTIPLAERAAKLNPAPVMAQTIELFILTLVC
jgi:hypothetical protein